MPLFMTVEEKYDDYSWYLCRGCTIYYHHTEIVYSVRLIYTRITYYCHCPIRMRLREENLVIQGRLSKFVLDDGCFS